MEIDVNELQLILLPGSRPPVSYREIYLKAYRCWRDVWEETYKKEMQIESYLASDDFTRQDEILALFHKRECAALTFFKWVNTDEIPTLHDTYFKPWPELALQKLCSQGSNIIVCSQFTVHQKYRKTDSNLSFKDLLMALLVERFRHSDADAMTGTMRLKKNMGEATYRTGATPLMKGLDYGKGEERIDLVAFYQDKVCDSVVPGISELVKLVFPKTIALVNPIIEHNIKELKNAA